jgi:SAM-dependent methyltransferase
MHTLPSERHLYANPAGWLLNVALFPLKMVVPQPLVARVPGLATNEDIRVGLVAKAVRGRLLDIGCGTNRLVRQYKEAGGDGVGVDVYPWPGVDTVVEDSARLPFADSAFDTATFVACLNHIPNREAVLREARRVVADDGHLVLTNLRPFVSRIWHAWAFWDKDQHERGMKDGEIWGFEPDELVVLLSRSGWRVVERQSFSWGLNELWLCAKERDP